MSEQKSILITGCSSGIGYTCALGMKERGWRVFATARKREDLDMLEAAGLEALYLDYTDPQSIGDLAETVLERTDNKLFALFNNGAYGLPGLVEDIPTSALRQQFEANVFGWHDLTCRLLPSMRENRQGRIIQCSSVLGLVTLKWRGPYNASKFALEGLTDTLRMELDGSGINVVSIQPGPIRSRFVENAVHMMKANIEFKDTPRRALYEARLRDQEKSFAKGSRPLETPQESRQTTAAGRVWWKPAYRLGPDAVLDALIDALESPNPRLHYRVTFATHLMSYCRRVLPARLMYKLAMRIS